MHKLPGRKLVAIPPMNRNPAPSNMPAMYFGHFLAQFFILFIFFKFILLKFARSANGMWGILWHGLNLAAVWPDPPGATGGPPRIGCRSRATGRVPVQRDLAPGRQHLRRPFPPGCGRGGGLREKYRGVAGPCGRPCESSTPKPPSGKGVG